jgi:hypothetical protein
MYLPLKHERNEVFAEVTRFLCAELSTLDALEVGVDPIQHAFSEAKRAWWPVAVVEHHESAEESCSILMFEKLGVIVEGPRPIM